jgi:hypothetical protein
VILLKRLLQYHGITIELLVPGEMAAGAVTSVAVIVQVPEEAKKKLPVIVAVPFAKEALEGSHALVSLLVIATASTQDVTMCQLGSQALILRSKGIPVACASGVPILPVTVPGALVSPGSRTSNSVATRLVKRK